jgi:outer membrane receptor protein involved in Fe transport
MYKLTEKIDLKLSWSRSFGLPPLENGTSGLLSSSGQFQINENTTIPADGTLGTITVANPNLKPQTSNNWDGEVSYYTNSGGKISLSYYFKDVTDQIETYSTYSGTPGFDEVLTALGLDPDSYQNWILRTSTNSTTNQRTSGWEAQINQDFRFLGNVGKRFSAFVSIAIKSLAEPSTPVPVEITTPSGSIVTVVPAVNTVRLSANHFGGAGLQYSGRRLSVQVRGTYRNRNEIARSSLPDVNGQPNFLRRFEPEQTNIDLTANYIISDHYSLFLSGRDIFNGSRRQFNRDDLGLLPEYAQAFDRREFGAVWTVGVNGRW